MKVIIEFDTDNAAFENDWTGEITELLVKSRLVLSQHGQPEEGKSFEIIGRLLDTNGNSVGHVRIEDKE